MSDSSISIVPRQSSYSNKHVKVKEVLDWLIAEDVIKPSPSNCILGLQQTGYSLSDGAKRVTVFPEDLPFDLAVNGLEVVTERQVFHTGENFVDELICPNCNANIAFDEWDLNPWSNKERETLTCPQCENAADIHTYTFEPEWGFSDLGFVFWNWPEFTDEFISAFKQKLGCEVSVVYQRI